MLGSRWCGFMAAFLAVCVWLTVTPAMAAKRVALVIGNSQYKHVPSLPNPGNDAADIAASFKRLNFDVTLKQDLSQGAMRIALRDFGRKAFGADMAVVYFAGHGIEVSRQNYLVPVDARLGSNLDVEYEALDLELVLRSVSGAKGLRLVLLDACRNNPFAASMTMAAGTRSVGRGLSRVEPTVGTLVSYAAKEGTTADDGEGRNSPYTSALLKHLEQPGVEINFLFRKVRDSVIRATNGQQEPFVYGSLPGKKIYFKAPEKVAAPAPAKPVKTQPVLQSPQQRGSNDLAAEMLFWNTVKDSKDPDVLQAYVSEYPNGKFARLAKILIGKYTPATEPELVPTPEPAPVQAQEQQVASINLDAPVTGRDDIAEIQRKLYDLHFEPGPADGVPGSKTTQAIREFQRKEGLAEDGRLSVGLLQSLRDKPVPSNWGAMAFIPSRKAVLRRTSVNSRRAVESSIRSACGNCGNVLIFSGRQCGVIAWSNSGWGWAARAGRKDAATVALRLCGKYGSGCRIRQTVCADGS